MGMDYNIPNPNEKIIKNLMLDFAKRLGKFQNVDGNFLTLLSENKDSYTVRVTKINSDTGENSESTEIISKEALESAIRIGCLKKIGDSEIE